MASLLAEGRTPFPGRHITDRQMTIHAGDNVRSPQQVALLREIGANHVVDPSAQGFEQDREGTIAETGATIAFDAIGGGTLANSIHHAMEAASIPARSRPTAASGFPGASALS